MSKLAIVSTNRKQYSETFIRMQVEQLLAKKTIYSDGYLPKAISTDLGKTFSLLKNKWWEKKKSPEALLERSMKERGIEKVLAQYGPSGVLIRNTCARLNIPLWVHFHGYDAYRNDVLQSYGREYNALFRQAQGIIVVSTHMQEQLLNLGCPNEKLHLIPYGVDPNLFQPSNTSSKAPTIVCCGRLVEKKGILFSIRAFHLAWKKFPEITLRIIGDGPLRQKAENLVDELGIRTSVHFLGVLPPEQVAGELSKVYAFIQHSYLTEENDSEGLPLSLLEAAASALPIVSTKHAGIPDFIHSELNGLLVEEKDWQGMAEHIQALLSNPEKARKMGQEAREKVVLSYTVDTYIQRLNDLILG
jgi:glycosyltransferase involved in cell wall biosynthesis